MKAISHLLVGGVLLFSAACSRSNTSMSAGSTSGSSTGTSTSMAASGSSGSSGSTSGATIGSGAGASSSSMGSTNAAGTTVMAGSGSARAADMTAFRATFATMPDPTFLMTAASSNMLEIQMGHMAAQKSSNADAKKYAKMMVDHHTMATQQLQAVASPLGVTLPQTMMPVHQAMADRLTDKTGKAFDKNYMDAMEVAHQMDIAMFEAKSSTAQALAVKTFAAKTLPMLRSHHTMANEVEKKVD